MGLHFAVAASGQEPGWKQVGFGHVKDKKFELEPDNHGSQFDLASVHGVICGGRLLAVTLTKTEERTELGVDGEDGDCLAVPKSITDAYEFFPLDPKSWACPRDLTASLSRLGERRIVTCKVTNTVSGGGVTGYAVFERVQTGLAGFFLSRANEIVWERHETVPRYGWRVGDKGKFQGEDLQFTWAMKRRSDGVLGMAYVWGGGEGINTVILEAQGKRLEPVHHFYRFSAP